MRSANLVKPTYRVELLAVSSALLAAKVNALSTLAPH
jgi:hypothetical protein